MKAILLYVSESWTITQRTIERLQVFVNKCLRRIVDTDIHWPDKIANKELGLRRQSDQEPILTEEKEKKNGTGLDTH